MASNVNVQTNECLLADAMQKHGATVKVIRLPDGPNGEKVGLDDYLISHSANDLRKLMEQAEAPEPPEPDEILEPAMRMDPATEAGRYLEKSKRQGHMRLRYWRETFWFWSASRYRQWPESEVRASLTLHINRFYFKVTRTAVTNVLEQVKALSIIKSTLDPPSWLDVVDGSDWNEPELLVCRNKIIHLPTLVTGRDALIDPTPALFSTTALDFDFVENDCSSPTRWLKFLNELWPNDPESILALQLWFGYLLTANTSLQKMLLLIGPKRGGKGTIVRILAALIGKRNVAGPTLSSLATNFGLWPLIDKSLAIIPDARLSGRTNGTVITERLLSITGEDALDVDRKHLSIITCQLPVRIMMLSNEMPRLADASGALVSRMIVLRLSETWLGSEDTQLTAKLLEELPEILWWAISGWHQLQRRGRLLQPASGNELVEELEELASPVGTFLKEECVTGSEHRISRSALFGAFKSWCKEKGRDFVTDEAGFGKALRAAYPKLKTVRPTVNSVRTRCYDGINLRVDVSSTS